MNLNQTQNYQLSQWESTDRILMSDFNSDNSKIDAALGTLAQTVTGHTTALAQKGNCQLYFDTYTGTGSGATVLTFPKAPKLVFITNAVDALSLTLTQGCNKAVTQNGSYSKTVNVSWSENSVSVTEPTNDMLYQCNLGSRTYYMVAMLTMDA